MAGKDERDLLVVEMTDTAREDAAVDGDDLGDVCNRVLGQPRPPGWK